MKAQGKRLMDMLGAAVGMLDDTEKLLPILKELGGRHVKYGVEQTHYGSGMSPNCSSTCTVTDA